MNLSQKQKAIINMLRQNQTITKVDCINLLGKYYYYNAEKYVGEILSRMVNKGTLIRIKPGVFKLGEGKKFNSEFPVTDNQQTLL